MNSQDKEARSIALISAGCMPGVNVKTNANEELACTRLANEGKEMKVTEHEMRGLLAGKCVPADMLVNEELPAYLVRKFADLHSDIKKQETAYAQAVDSILMALKDKELVQDRLEDAEDKLQESREKLDAVLSENLALKAFPCQLLKFLRTLGTSAIGSQTYAKIETAVSKMKTPTTDAILNEVRAEGIHFAVNRMLAAWESGFVNDTPEQAFDISGGFLTALEFLPNASPDEFKRDYLDEVRAGIADQLRTGSTEGGV